ncbi:glycosyltransferase family 2 protein [Candidatus Giovannonibacteria bacterium]|nr:glycosyltransferase family 2 protein [Candidatus Giovannonibacteria bacterium]
MPHSFSIVIPVYNEEKRIPKNIDSICEFFSKVPERTEIIFVNDGSRDDTQKILENYKSKYGFKIVEYKKNTGKGYAVRQGALAASSDWVIFFDIDLATPLSEFEQLKLLMEPSDQIIIGSRRLSGSKVQRSESFLRIFLGQGFSKLSNLFVPGIPDFTCGFKCFSKEATVKIFPRARINRWAFDTELLYIARLKQIPIRQMPVSWAHDDDSRVRVLSDIVSSAKELLQIKINHWRGLYY